MSSLSQHLEDGNEVPLDYIEEQIKLAEEILPLVNSSGEWESLKREINILKRIIKERE